MNYLNFIASLVLIVFGATQVYANPNAVPAASKTELLEQLREKGFKCQNQAGGDVCVKQANIGRGRSRYNREVALVIPDNLTFPVNFVMHLNGFRGVCPDSNKMSLPGMVKTHSLLTQMNQAAEQTGNHSFVMVLPTVVGKKGSYSIRRDVEPNLQGLADFAKSSIPHSTDDWIISSHSGGGHALVRGLEQAPELRKHTKAGIVLDGAYGGWKCTGFRRGKCVSKVFTGYPLASNFNRLANQGVYIQSSYRPDHDGEQQNRALRNLHNDNLVVTSSSRGHCEMAQTELAGQLVNAINKRFPPATQPFDFQEFQLSDR